MASRRALRVNSYGPLRVSAAFLDHVAASTPAQVAHATVLAIEQLKPEQNGKFYSLAGKELPW